MLYSKLLLSAGGGIISQSQQAEQIKNTASILIGLGGTGIDCLRTIKTQVHSSIKSDNGDTVFPEYKHIQFIGVDCDIHSTGARRGYDCSYRDSRLPLDLETEYFDIRLQGPIGAVFPKIAAAPYMSWINLEASSLFRDACFNLASNRQAGRFMIMVKADEFMGTIAKAITKAGSDFNAPNVNIHIFSGISGGTGSGTFLDVCYMVRKVTEDIPNVKIFGYFFMPDVNLNRMPRVGNEGIHKRIKINGYAAMQELDYCMGLPENGGSFEQKYKGGTTIEWNSPPVDMCHLICGVDEQGNLMPNPYEYAINATAEYVMDFLTDAEVRFALGAHIAGFAAGGIEAQNKKRIGVNLNYATIGTARAHIPWKEMNTYLAAELFDKFSCIGSNVPVKADVENLAIKALGKGIADVVHIYDSLLAELENGVFPIPFESFPVGMLIDEKALIDFKNAKTKTIEINAKSMASEKNTTSVIGRVHSCLRDVVRDIDRGPIFAYRMLEVSSTHNLLNVIDGLIAENNDRLDQANYERINCRNNYETARSDFLNRTKRRLFDSDTKRLADYEKCAQEEVIYQLRVELYEKLREVLFELRTQVSLAASAYYRKLSNIVTNLLETFRENKSILASGEAIRTDTSSIPMLTISEISGTLDAEIEKFNIPNMMGAFMDFFIANESKWLLEDEGKITELVTDFFVNTAFRDFANRNITLFLQDKYSEELGANKENIGQLSNLIKRDWIDKLKAKASPLFMRDIRLDGASDHSEQKYISVPTTCEVIKEAAVHPWDIGWRLKECAALDGILAVHLVLCFPMCTYYRLEEYAHEYYSAALEGVHLYEGENVPGMEFNDWRNMAPIKPQSLITDAAELEKVKAAQDLFEDAFALNIFDDTNRICKPAEDKLAELKDIVEFCRRATAVYASAEEVQAQRSLLGMLEAAMKIPMIPTGYWLPKEGIKHDPVAAKRILKDNFVSSPVLQLRVREIVSGFKTAVDEAKRVKTELKIAIDKAGA